MKKNTMMANTLLAVVLGAGLLVAMILRTFVPNVVLPQLDLNAMVGITLITLCLEYYIVGKQERRWLIQIVLATVTFGGMPLAAGLLDTVLRNCITGAIVFTIVTFLFDSMVRRLEVTTERKCAIIPTAFVLYLACQCFMGMF